MLLVAPATVHAATSIPLEDWTPALHDQFVVDTQHNIGYLIHESSIYTSFRVATGRRSVIRYAGMTYDASTPTRSWVAKSLEVQTDKRMFGDDGKFFRLYTQGKHFTHYGIHGISNSEEILAGDDRFVSYGCVIVSDELMDLIEQTFSINNGALPVTTAYGPSAFLNALAAHEVKAMVSQREWLK